MLVGASGVGDGGEDVVQVLAVKSGDRVGERAVGQRVSDAQDAQFTAGGGQDGALTFPGEDLGDGLPVDPGPVATLDGVGAVVTKLARLVQRLRIRSSTAASSG